MTERPSNGWRRCTLRIVVRRNETPLRWRLDPPGPSTARPSAVEEAAMAARIDMVLRFIEFQQPE